VLKIYQSTGGVTSVWIDLDDDSLANPANWETEDWRTGVLVLTERGGKYFDLWQEEWLLEGGRTSSSGDNSDPHTCPRQ
jgi:hypothetical protein